MCRINIKNDVALQRLIHTSLLPSHAQETMLDISGAQRKKSLAGRVLEVSDPSHVRLGQGERKVREKERDRAGKKVRDGMMRKKSEREAKTLAEVKLFSLLTTVHSHPFRQKRLARIILL